MKIVVIEDNADLNELLVEELEAGGYHATGYLSVESYEISNMQAEIYMLDINLPGETGLSFAARLRADRPNVGIVAITVRTGTDIRTQSYDSGVDIYLQKPCDSREIIAAIKSMVRRLGRPEVPARGLTLHPAELLVAGPDGKAQITPSEVAMLRVMATAPDRLLPYAEVQALLGARNTPTLATMEVRITRLRKKITAALRGERAIVSIRNVGYRLLVPMRLEESSNAVDTA